MAAEQAEVVGQNVTVERFTELRAERTTTDPTGQAAKDGARYGAEGDADRAGERADSCASLTTSQGSADATRNTAHGTDGGTDFHGVMEGSDCGGMTARALQ
ncbi:hypothetical protein AN457_26940 [Pseudomonas aeruginosa]|nr:hypothetical protein AN457_26940 [Pseudomonas aeruginosa]